MKIDDRLLYELSIHIGCVINKDTKQFTKRFNKLNSNQQIEYVRGILTSADPIIKQVLQNSVKLDNMTRAVIAYQMLIGHPKRINVVLTELINNRDEISIIRNFCDSHRICDLAKKNRIVINDDVVFIANKNKTASYKVAEKLIVIPDYVIPINVNHKTHLSEYDLSEVGVQYNLLCSGLCYKVHNGKLYAASRLQKNSLGLSSNEFKFLGGGYVFHQINNIEQIQNNTIRGNDWVKHYMFTDTKIKGYLYFIKLNIDGIITYKVGITKNIDKRYTKKEMENFISYDYFEMYMLEAAVLERYIHLNNHSIKDNSFIGKESTFTNVTELYHQNILESYINDTDMLTKAIEHLDEEEYPIPSYMVRDLINRLHK